MSDFEDSPRPSKRQKTSEIETLLPLSTRALQAVRNVFGSRTSPHENDLKLLTGDDSDAGALDGGATVEKQSEGSIWTRPLSTLERWKLARQQNGARTGQNIKSSPVAKGSAGSPTPKKRRKRKAAADDDTLSTGKPIGGTATEAARKSNGTNGLNHGNQIVNGGAEDTDDGADPIQDVNGMATPRAAKATGPYQSPASKDSRHQLNGSAKARTLQTGARAATSDTPSTQKRGRPTKASIPIANGHIEHESDLGFKVIVEGQQGKPGREKSIPMGVHDGKQVEHSSTNTVTPTKARPRTSQADTSRTPKAKQTKNELLHRRSPSPDLDLAQAEPDGVTAEQALEELQKALENVSQATLNTFKASLLSSMRTRQHAPCRTDAEKHFLTSGAEYQKVHNLLSQTVLAGEGNSMLIIGSRGSGKTTLVESAISHLVEEENHSNDFHVVRLNGFIHTDDKLALREIWRQLGREMEVEDGDGPSNYADTLASLLALLSHTPESYGEETESRREETAKAVIFILDEFDLFASHPRQTLLYNLFDVAQSRNAPIAVLGLTTKISVVENLEKRVKSRFGQRYVHLSLPRNFGTFTEMCMNALIPESPEPSKKLQLQQAMDSQDLETLTTAWKQHLTHLFRSPTMLPFLRQIHTTSASLPLFLTSALIPISLLTSSPSSIPTPHSFITSPLHPPDSKLHLLPSLSELALSLLIAAARLDIVLDTDLCNFEMVYEEYVSLASRLKQQTSASGQLALGMGGRVWGKGVARGEWERLGRLELVLPATGEGGIGRPSALKRGRMWRVDVGLEEIPGAVPGMGKVMERWCKEI